MLNDFWNDVTSFGSLVLSLFAIVVSFALGENLLGFLLFFTLFLCYFISFPIKVLFFKRRPNNQKYSTILEKFDAASFPSVHSMRAVSFGIVLGLSFQSLLFWILALVVIGGVLYSRIRLQKHFLVDVVWGSIIGVFVAVVCSYAGPFLYSVFFI